MTTDEALALISAEGWAFLSLVNKTLTAPDYLAFIKQKINLTTYRCRSGRGETPAQALISALNSARDYTHAGDYETAAPDPSRKAISLVSLGLTQSKPPINRRF